MKKDFWDDWRGSQDGRPVLWIKRLIKRAGFRLDLHKMVRPDDAECFHTHPAKAIRLVLWGGYIEEFEDGERRTWWPGRCGIVHPALCHRIAATLRGPSYSLWFRWPASHEVELRGTGWK